MASALLNGVITGFVDKVTFEQRLEGSEEVSRVVSGRRALPAERTAGQVPQEVVHLAFSCNSDQCEGSRVRRKTGCWGTGVFTARDS